LNADAIRQSGTHLKHRPSPLSHGRYLAPSDTDPSIRPNSYAEWGPPPETATTTVVVGYDRAQLGAWFGSCWQAARIDNGVGLHNEEQGRPVWVCRDRLLPWVQLWPKLRHVG